MTAIKLMARRGRNLCLTTPTSTSGRSVVAQEALQMGLVNRVVNCGSALGQAVNLATLVAKFPQQCLRADRMSAYHAAYDAADFKSALDYELEHGSKVLASESVQGKSFTLESTEHMS